MDYLRLFHEIDLALDPFPYNGHTTTCDALWMGVPVLTLAGKMAPARISHSLLANVGLGELAVESEAAYIQLAATLARDLPRLQKLRAGLRQRMQASPLMDAPRFARHVEAAYRDIWRRWCTA
jgi:predicted O-linked N-acetylglucosamine transferase (SPINDLY family)